MSNYKPVIGLEIHVELKTKNKMFCQCEAWYFGKKPNTNTCPVCLGLPGALPVPNKKAIEWTMLIGQALNCQITKISKFDRKHYFYPDLPKGYQISQYDEPIAVKGSVSIGDKEFRIHRVHLEEDTGKLIHLGAESLIDFNRSGVPLVEIVTEPDFDNSDDVKRFLEELQTIIRYLGVSDADMEKGTMRLEPNISLKKEGEKGLPKYKVEVKNINSFKFVQKAIEFELKRQQELLEKGETPSQETRGFNETKGITFSQRSKEEAHDYRYFPEPDIPPLEFEQKYIDKVAKELPELPQEKLMRYVESLGLRQQDAFILTRDRGLSEYFEKANKELNAPQKIANLIVNKKTPVDIDIDDFIGRIKELLRERETDLSQVEEVLKKVINHNQKVVVDYRAGKQNAIMVLIGQAMRELKGAADANIIREELIKKLKS